MTADAKPKAQEASAIETNAIRALQGIVAVLKHAETELLDVQAALHAELEKGARLESSAGIQRLDSATQSVAGAAAFAEGLIKGIETGGDLDPSDLGDGIRPQNVLDRLLLAGDCAESSGDATFF